MIPGSNLSCNALNFNINLKKYLISLLKTYLNVNEICKCKYITRINCFTYVNLHQIVLPIISIYNISTYKYYKYDYNHDISD